MGPKWSTNTCHGLPRKAWDRADYYCSWQPKKKTVAAFCFLFLKTWTNFAKYNLAQDEYLTSIQRSVEWQRILLSSKSFSLAAHSLYTYTATAIMAACLHRQREARRRPRRQIQETCFALHGTQQQLCFGTSDRMKNRACSRGVLGLGVPSMRPACPRRQNLFH